MASCNIVLNQLPKAAAILVTGSAGFVGRNLVANLKVAGYTNILEYDVSSPEGTLEEYAQMAGFVFHLAGVNRPKNPEEFYSGNADLTGNLLNLLANTGRKVPVVLTSSAQAGNGSDYAKSKEEAEKKAFSYQAATGSPVYIYRLPGVFGKWSRPSYNSVVATFCHNIARGLPIEVRDPAYSFPLCYIDDVVKSFQTLLQGASGVPFQDGYYQVEPVYTVTLGALAATLQSFKNSRSSLSVADMKDDFTRKLYATYLAFLPEDDFSYPLTMNVDNRGSFTEFLRTEERGQVSVNVAKPGIVKGNHWHNTKNEKFLVVKGEGVIRFRKVGETEITEYPVTGETLTVVDIPTGYTHNIENTGTDDLVTVMWANEPFDPENPDTFFEPV